MAKPDLLIGPRLKIARAQKHFDELKSALAGFFETNPYAVICKTDSKTGQKTYFIKIEQSIPGEIGVVVGDVVHNLRSALDQIVCCLFKCNGKQISGSNGLPVATSRERFRETRVGKLKNLSPKATRFINRLKPYDGGNSSLFLLAELDNLDKHNQIVPVASGKATIQTWVGMPSLFVSPEGGLAIGNPPIEEGYVPLGHHLPSGVPEDFKPVSLLQEETEVYRSPVPFPFNEKIAFFVDVTFGKTKVTRDETLLGTLDHLIKLTKRIFEIVERRLI